MTATPDRLQPTWFRPGAPDQHVRVSDADRGAVADLLARHYGDGRLDQAEFDERVTRAMTAKTNGDFRGLLDDLPDLPAAPSDGAAEPVAPPTCLTTRRHRRHSVLPGLLFLVFALVTWHHLADWGGEALMWLVVLAAVVTLASQLIRRR